MTQNDKILAYMKEHGKITSLDAFQHLRITRLSARIFDLRKMGKEIQMYRKKTEEGGTYAVYYLAEEHQMP